MSELCSHSIPSQVGAGVNRSARGEVQSTLSGQMDWILRYIKTFLFDV